MKKALASLVLGAALATTANAQELAQGSSSTAFTVGGIAGEIVVGGAVFATWAVGAATNSNGNMGGPDGEPVIVYCADDADDVLLNGECVGTTSTVTVTASGTGTATKTITVPVTYTYLPTVVE